MLGSNETTWKLFKLFNADENTIYFLPLKYIFVKILSLQWLNDLSNRWENCVEMCDSD